MTKKQYEELLNALETRTRDSGEEFVCTKDDISIKTYNTIRDVAFKLDNSDLDLTYDILQSALWAMDDMTLTEFKNCDVYELDANYSSVYNYQRLKYINIHNQDEIAETVRDMGQDIVTAAAYWYDCKVTEALLLFQEQV